MAMRSSDQEEQEGWQHNIIALATFALAGALFRTIATLVGNLDEGSAPKREGH
jgi:hypothetical protein